MSQCHDSYDYWASSSSGDEEGRGRASATWAPQAFPVGPPGVAQARNRVVVFRLHHWMDWEARRNLRAIGADVTRPDIVVHLCSTSPDISGAAVLLSFVAKSRQKGQRVVIVAEAPLPYQRLLAGGLHPSVPVVQSEDEAFAWLGSHPLRGTAG